MLVIEPYTDEQAELYYLKSDHEPGFTHFDERDDYDGYLAILQSEPLKGLLFAHSEMLKEVFPLYDNRDKTEEEVIVMVKAALANARKRRAHADILR